MRFSAMAVVTVFLAVPALAQSGDATQPVKPKPICRSLMITGSRMPTRSCHTAKEWEDIEAGRRHDVDRGNMTLNTISKIQTDHVGTPAYQ